MATSGRARRWAAAAAGPALIVLVVLLALRGFAFESKLTNDHPDLLSFWLPRWTFLGRSLAEGHIPLWNPFEMMGYRFAADPQGGWLYAAPMLAFSMLPPGAAIGAMIVLHPVLAGLGLFAFLRSERLGRVAATAAGLSAALLIASSELAVSMPFAGFLAWTTVVLLAASRYAGAERWSSRLAWLALGAFGWTQVANAHMSHGLVICSLLLIAYLLAGGVAAVRDRPDGRERAITALGRPALFLAVLPLAALPVLVPRLATIEASSLGSGYDRLGPEVRDLAGIDERPIQANGVWAAWPIAYGVAPGAHLGAAMLLAIPLAARARRHRALVWAFAGTLALVWVLMLNAVVTAGWFRSLMDRVPFGDVYLHNPGRLRLVAVLALPVLGAVGIQSLVDSPLSLRRLLPWLAAGCAAFVLLPIAAGGRFGAFGLLLGATLPAAAALAAIAAGRRWAGFALTGILSFELVVSGVWGSVYPETLLTGLEGGDHSNLVAQPLQSPDLEAASYLRPTAFVSLIGEDRYLTWAPPYAYYEKGYLFAQRRIDWPALVMGRGTLFRIRDVLGYNPIQLIRYWTYVRATHELDRSLYYNASVIAFPSIQDVRLMAVRYVIVPEGTSPTVPGHVIANADGYDLVLADDAQPLVSVVPSWRVVGGLSEALAPLAEPKFDPASEAILEADPGIDPLVGAVPGEARSMRSPDPEHLTFEVTSRTPAVVLIRTSYDEGWQATVDGRPSTVFAADGFLQGVAIGPGRHEVRLTYADAAVTQGLLLGSVVWFILAAVCAACRLAERRGDIKLRKAPEP